MSLNLVSESTDLDLCEDVYYEICEYLLAIDIQNFLQTNKICAKACTRYIKRNKLMLFNVYKIDLHHFSNNLYYPVDPRTFNSFLLKKLQKKYDSFTTFDNCKVGDLLISTSICESPGNINTMSGWTSKRKQGWIKTIDGINTLQFYKMKYILPWSFLTQINPNNLHKYKGHYIEHHSLYITPTIIINNKLQKIFFKDTIIYEIT